MQLCLYDYILVYLALPVVTSINWNTSNLIVHKGRSHFSLLNRLLRLSTSSRILHHWRFPRISNFNISQLSAAFTCPRLKPFSFNILYAFNIAATLWDVCALSHFIRVKPKPQKRCTSKISIQKSKDLLLISPNKQAL